MATRNNDGGPAFPLQDWDPVIQSRRNDTGMTLRDYFAAKAMAMAYDHYSRDLDTENCSGHDFPWSEERYLAIVADASYELADAMLKARAK